MTEEKKTNSKDVSEIESEMYAIVNIIINLYSKFQNGNLNDNFFQKSIKKAMNDLIKVNFLLNENNIILTDILKKMNLEEKYFEAIDIINETSSLSFSNSILGTDNINQSISSKKLRVSMLELPGVTSKITSSFITLMDALELEAIKDRNLIIKLFKELKNALQRFPGLELIQSKIEIIYNDILNNFNKLASNQNFKESIGDDLYNVYKEFQRMLNLTT
jgi:hypothetical protein